MVRSNQILDAVASYTPEIIHNREQMFDDYRLSESDAVRDREQCLYLLIEGKKLCIASADDSFLMLFPQAVTFQVIKAVIQQFQDDTQREEVILSALSRIHNITDLARFTGELFGNPVIVNDSAYNVITGYLPPNSPYDDPLVQTIMNGYYSYDYLVRIQAQGEEVKTLTGNYRGDSYICEIDGCKYRRMVKKLFNRNQWIGAFCIIESFKSFDEIDVRTFDRIGDLCALLLSAETSKRDYDLFSQERLVRDLLDRKITNECVLNYRLALCRWVPQEGMTILSLQIEHYHYTGTGIDELREQFKHFFPKNICLFYQNFLILLVGRWPKNAQFNQDLEEYLASKKIVAGVSNIFNDMLSMPDYLEQAIQTLHIANMLHRTGNLFFYLSFQFQILLLNSKKGVQEWAALQMPVVKEIIDYDAKKHTQYYQTLKSYLRNDKNTVKTSRELCVHENTVIYRIHRINDLFSINLAEPTRLHELYMAIQIQELLDAFS